MLRIFKDCRGSSGYSLINICKNLKWLQVPVGFSVQLVPRPPVCQIECFCDVGGCLPESRRRSVVVGIIVDGGKLRLPTGTHIRPGRHQKCHWHCHTGKNSSKIGEFCLKINYFLGFSRVVIRICSQPCSRCIFAEYNFALDKYEGYLASKLA